MKNKLIYSLLVILMIFTITGCGTKKEEKNEEVIGEFKVRNVTFRFDKDGSFEDFSYKYSSKMKLDGSQNTVYLTYENDDIVSGKFVFRIALYSREETNIKTLFSDPKYSDYTTKKINGLKWNIYSLDVDNVKTYIYATEKNGKVYITNIGSYKKAEIDLDTLSNVFMNGVKIK